jgi:hypothetical protein
MGRETLKHKSSKIRIRAEAVVIINRAAIGNKVHPGVETAREN